MFLPDPPPSPAVAVRSVDADAATAVITGGSTESLTARENALAGWARAVARDPNGSTLMASRPFGRRRPRAGRLDGVRS